MKDYYFKTAPYITTMIDISTGHLSKKERDLLEEASTGETTNPVIAYKFEYGYLVALSEDTETEVFKQYGYSDQFCDILKNGEKRGCSHVKFDADGIIYEDLEEHTW